MLAVQIIIAAAGCRLPVSFVPRFAIRSSLRPDSLVVPCARRFQPMYLLARKPIQQPICANHPFLRRNILQYTKADAKSERRFVENKWRYQSPSHGYQKPVNIPSQPSTREWDRPKKDGIHCRRRKRWCPAVCRDRDILLSTVPRSVDFESVCPISGTIFAPCAVAHAECPNRSNCLSFSKRQVSMPEENSNNFCGIPDQDAER